MRKNRKEKGGQLANYYPKLYCGSGFSAFPENGNPAESGRHLKNTLKIIFFFHKNNFI